MTSVRRCFRSTVAVPDPRGTASGEHPEGGYAQTPQADDISHLMAEGGMWHFGFFMTPHMPQMLFHGHEPEFVTATFAAMSGPGTFGPDDLAACAHASSPLPRPQLLPPPDPCRSRR